MKQLYANLKENSNNVLILAIVFSLGIYFILESFFLVSDLYYCVIGEEGYSWSDELEFIIESTILIVVVAAGLLSAVMSCTKNRKWILVTIVVLAGLLVYQVSLGWLNCLILAVVWHRNAKAESQLDDRKLLKTAVMLAVFSFVSVLTLPVYGVLLWLLGSSNADSTWMMFVFGSQLMSFIIKPEIIVMIHLFRKSKGQEDDVYRKIRLTTKVYFALWLLLAITMLMTDLAQNGMLSQWFGIGSTGVEAGDWSEWETE